MMSRPQSLVATSAYVFGGFTGCFWCRDFSPLLRQQLQLNQLHLCKPVIASRRFSCRDLITGLCKPQNCNINQPVAFFSALPFELHFYSTNCCIFLLLFLLSSTLPANNKLVSFFIFLHINCPFLDENQAEKWTKNR